MGEEKESIIAANITTPIPVAAITYFSKSLKNHLENIKEFFQIEGLWKFRINLDKGF